MDKASKIRLKPLLFLCF